MTLNLADMTVDSTYLLASKFHFSVVMCQTESCAVSSSTVLAPSVMDSFLCLFSFCITFTTVIFSVCRYVKKEVPVKPPAKADFHHNEVCRNCVSRGWNTSALY